MIDIKGRTALITGSSRGVGQQLALGLARLGCHIILHGRTIESTERSAGLLENHPVKVHRVYAELSSPEGVKQVVRQVEDLGVQVDILYNNAAIMKEYHNDIWSHSWDEWIDTFKVNVLAMYDLCGAFIPGMIERGFGRVVNLSSDIKNIPQLAPYAASKGAVNKITQDIASTLDGTGVRINMLHPGWLSTDMGGDQAPDPVQSVLPGGLVPVLVEDDGPNGEFFEALNSDV
jgi:NAD(P)-dependent dehydrogenase (short-subunit alcohol dehydrogenase family)